MYKLKGCELYSVQYMERMENDHLVLTDKSCFALGSDLLA